MQKALETYWILLIWSIKIR